MEKYSWKYSHHDYQSTKTAQCSAVPYHQCSGCPDRSELQNLFGKSIHIEYVIPSVQGIFVCGLMSWRTNNSNIIFVIQTQQRQAIRLFGVSIHWLDFTIVSLGKKFVRRKPFSFQNSSIIMVQKSVAITFLVYLCACISILGIY